MKSGLLVGLGTDIDDGYEMNYISRTLRSLLHSAKKMSHGSPLECVISVDGEFLRFVFIKGEPQLVLYTPTGRTSDYYVSIICHNLQKVLKSQYGSVDSVVHDIPTKALLENLVLSISDKLTPMALLHDVLQSITCSSTSSVPHYLHLPNYMQLLLEDSLTELESTDFENHTIFDQPFCQIVGTAYFCHGYLLCSHLSPEELTNVHTFLCLHHIMGRSKKQHQYNLVLWRPYFRLNNQDSVGNSGYLLIVVQQHSIMVMILGVPLLNHLSTKFGHDHVTGIKNTIHNLDKHGIRDWCLTAVSNSESEIQEPTRPDEVSSTLSRFSQCDSQSISSRTSLDHNATRSQVVYFTDNAIIVVSKYIFQLFGEGFIPHMLHTAMYICDSLGINTTGSGLFDASEETAALLSLPLECSMGSAHTWIVGRHIQHCSMYKYVCVCSSDGSPPNDMEAAFLLGLSFTS